MQTIMQAVQKIEAGWKSQRIRLAGQTLGNGDFINLCDILAEHPSIKSLELCVCRASEANIVMLLERLHNFNLLGIQLAHINTSATVKMRSNIAAVLGTAMQEAVGLKKVDITFNEIGEEGCMYISNALLECGVECLLMARNEIGTKGAIYMANILANKPTTLKTLDLTGNNVGNDGGMAFVEVIEKSGLECLLLGENGLSPSTAIAICNAVTRSNTLVELCLSGVDIRSDESDEALEAIVNMLTTSKIESLALNNCHVGLREIEALSRGIKACATLDSLELRANTELTDEAISHFVDNIGPHLSLKRVETEDSGLSENGVQVLVDRLQALRCKRSRVLTALVTPKIVARIGVQSPIKNLSVDIMRRLLPYLTPDNRPLPVT